MNLLALYISSMFKIIFWWKCKYCSTTCLYLISAFDLPLVYYHCGLLGNILELFLEKATFITIAGKVFFFTTYVLLSQSMFCLILIIASGKTGGLPSVFGSTADQGSLKMVKLKPSGAFCCVLTSHFALVFHSSSS